MQTSHVPSVPPAPKSDAKFDFYRRTCNLLGAYTVDRHLDLHFARIGCSCVTWLECVHGGETMKALRLLRKQKKR